MNMKAVKKYLLICLLILSLSCNALLLYFYLFQERKPSASITKFTFNNHDTVIYCEKTEPVGAIKLESEKKTFTIGDSKLINENDAVYFKNKSEKINLSDYEGFGFVINSNGELLYSLNTPVKKQETVYVTPSGKKYHKDFYCAGKSGFEVSIETAKLFRNPCNICT